MFFIPVHLTTKKQVEAWHNNKINCVEVIANHLSLSSVKTFTDANFCGSEETRHGKYTL